MHPKALKLNERLKRACKTMDGLPIGSCVVVVCTILLTSFGCIDIVAKKEGVPFTRWIQVTAAASWTHKLVEMLTVPWGPNDLVEVWHRRKGRDRHFAVFQIHPSPTESGEKGPKTGGFERV